MSIMNKYSSIIRLVILFTFSITLQLCIAQNYVQGKIVDEKGKPVPFVNIGIENTYVGTVSEPNGDFELKIPEEFITEIILFSSIGYHKTSIPINENIGRVIEIVLKENILQLNEIVVKENRIKPKIKKLGKISSFDTRFLTDTTYSGAAMAQLITSPFDTTFIHWINFGYINNIEDLQLRVKFKSIDSNGRPGELLINKEIIVKLYEFNGYHKIRFDNQYLFVMEKEFFIELEPLVLKKNRKEIHDIILSAMKETPQLVKYNEYGEILVKDQELDLKFIQFKVSTKKDNNTFYRTSSFGKWYPSEKLALEIGISDGTDKRSASSDRLSELEKLEELIQQKNNEKKTSIDFYEYSGKILYPTLAHHLRRIGGITVEGKIENDIKVLIREGAMSAKFSMEPIFVIDGANIGRGYRSTLNSVDVNQIKSIRVLKGPAQTAIYGEQGRNGVIIIKTKNN